MLREYPKDFIDGKYVSPLVITEDYVLLGEHNGSVQVESGEFILVGTIKGSLHIHDGATAKIIGSQRGSVSIDSGSVVIVEGNIQGSASLQPDSKLIIEKNAKLAGSLNNNGTVILRGVFGGNTSGYGELIVEDSGYIKRPVVKNGISYYEW